MTSNNLTSRPIDVASFIKCATVGTTVGLAVILFFVLQADSPRPEWGRLWMVRPLIVEPLAGAVGGGFAYLMHYYLGYQGGAKKILSIIITVIVCFVGLWMGIVIGLNGTMWN